MKGKIKIEKEVDFNQIIVGKYKLSEIFKIIEKNTINVIQEISIQNQSDIPNYVDIDTPLYRILNLLEELKNER